MPSAPLIQITPQQGLVTGLFPSTEKTAGPVWRDGTNVIFNQLDIEPGFGNLRQFTGLTRAPQVMVQGAVGTVARLYYETGGQIFHWDGAASTLIGTLDANGSYDLEPYGAWLLATDYVNNVKLWKNTGTFINIGASEFAKGYIVRKLQQHVLVYNTNVFPNGFHWSAADNPEVWTPSSSNRAGNLPIREFDGEIKAVAQLGIGHAVYGTETMAIVTWIGGQNVFSSRIALTGIGASSKRSIIEWKRMNFGLHQAGIFQTDGTQFEYVDRPAFDTWLRDTVVWTRASEIFGYNDERLSLLVWSVPVLGGTSRIGLHPQRKTLTRLSGSLTAGSEKQVFSYPFVADSNGVYYASLASESRPASTLQSNPLDAGAPLKFKQWDVVNLFGTMGGLQIRLGYSDDESAAPEWTEWYAATRNVTPPPRESVYLTIDLKSDLAATPWKLSGIHVHGEPAGHVI